VHTCDDYDDDDDDDDDDVVAVDCMSSTVDLSGIEVVDADRRFIRQAHKDVELQAHKMLQQGIESQVTVVVVVDDDVTRCCSKA